MKKINILFLAIFLVAACQDDEVTPPNTLVCDNAVVVDANLYINAPSDALSIISVNLDGDCLNIEFSATGCDGTGWEIQLLDANEIMESLPVQKNIRLSLDNDEVCDFNPVVQLSFDLTDARVEGEGKILFNLEGWGEVISYDY